MPDLVGIFRQFVPLEFGFALEVENAKLDLGRIGRKQREVDAQSVLGGAQRKGTPFAHVRARQARSIGR